MSRNRLYLLFTVAILVAYGWILWFSFNRKHSHSFTPCFFKNVTGIACPSCGTTRSVMMLTQGNFKDALLINPLGIIAGIAMLIVPFWLLYDIILKKDTLYLGFKKSEAIIRSKWIALILLLLILINWAWNIQKGL